MRSLKLTPAVTAVATLLALSPATASAGGGHPRLHSPKPAIAGSGGCRIDIFAEPHTVTSETVQLFGQLRCRAGTSPEGQTVTVFERVAGIPGIQTLGTVTTKEKEAGFYSIIDSSVSADTTFYASALGARSRATRVKVAPVVELGAPTPAEGSQLQTGKAHAVTFAGTVAPADEGAELVLQRENAVGVEDWHVIQHHEFVGEKGKFSFIHRFVVPGDANIRLVVRPHGKFTVRGLSTSVSYQISQTENPQLTIETTADSVPPGEPVKISGKLAAGAGQKVILFSHPRGTAPFTKVGEATTEAEGKYSFPEIPPQNTFYMVSGPGVRSAVLFQGVKDVLTPATPPTTAAQGETVTFTGTVAPGQEGQPVYLEHANLFGGGFHVIGEGNLTEVKEGKGKYSISHAFEAAGSGTLRIKVPGNPANQGAVSAPFVITVTPAPLPLLKPMPASKLPSEGQV